MAGLKFGGTLNVTVYLVRSGQVWDPGATNPALEFGLRAVGSPTLVALEASGFEKQSDFGFLAAVTFDSTELLDALGTEDSVDCVGEFRCTPGDGETIPSLDWPLRVYRQVLVAGATGPVPVGYPPIDAVELKANKGADNGYAGLDATGKVPSAQLPPYPTAPDLSGYQPTSAKGVASGYAGLDTTGKVPAANLPAASGGGGDMLAATYASGANPSSHPVDRALEADHVAWAGIPDKPTVYPPDATAELVTRKGAANGYAGLGSDGKVPSAQLPAGSAPDLSGYQQTSAKGVASGYAGLGTDGKVPAAQLPAATGASLSGTQNLAAAATKVWGEAGDGTQGWVHLDGSVISTLPPVVATLTADFNTGSGGYPMATVDNPGALVASTTYWFGTYGSIGSASPGTYFVSSTASMGSNFTIPSGTPIYASNPAG